MEKNNTVFFPQPEDVTDPLTELLRQGARQLIQQAVEAELTVFLEQFSLLRDDRGRRKVIRNGYLPERTLLTGIGPVSVQIPKVRQRGGEPTVFQSALVPPYVRRTRKMDAALPWLYLKGISTGNMKDALSVLVGPEARGLSASVVSRLKEQWTKEYEDWRKSPLDRDRWVYLWADGIYSSLRGDAGRLCALVIIGVNERGQKQFLAIEDGVRESKQSWREVLLGLKERGLILPPKLATGDGAMGFWGALEEIYPDTRHQRCWVHKVMNVLNYLPKTVQPKAKGHLREIQMAETRKDAEKAFNQFVALYQAKYPKATECLSKDRKELLAFYDFPAEHWSHIRSTNVIESTFGTLRHRTDRAKGCVSRNTILAMLFKLGMCAEKRWRKIRGFAWLAQVIEGVPFQDGVLQNAGTESETGEDPVGREHVA